MEPRVLPEAIQREAKKDDGMSLWEEDRPSFLLYKIQRICPKTFPNGDVKHCTVT